MDAVELVRILGEADLVFEPKSYRHLALLFVFAYHCILLLCHPFRDAWCCFDRESTAATSNASA
jgi:hypothetical protein